MRKRKYDWGYAVAWVVGELLPALTGIGIIGYLVYLMFERI